MRRLTESCGHAHCGTCALFDVMPVFSAKEAPMERHCLVVGAGNAKCSSTPVWTLGYIDPPHCRSMRPYWATCLSWDYALMSGEEGILVPLPNTLLSSLLHLDGCSISRLIMTGQVHRDYFCPYSRYYLVLAF